MQGVDRESCKAEELSDTERRARAWLELQKCLMLELQLGSGAAIHVADAIYNLIRAQNKKPPAISD